jgi:hypothetical protein
MFEVIKIESLGKNVDFDKLNFANTEFRDRHPDAKETPKQIVLSFEKWDNLVKFLRKYFEHFGIDVSSLDDSQLMVVIKTVYRMSNVCAYKEGFKDGREMAPSFHEQLVDFFNGMAEEMEDDPCITWTDFIPKDCKKLCSTYDMHIDAFG